MQLTKEDQKQMIYTTEQYKPYQKKFNDYLKETGKNFNSLTIREFLIEIRDKKSAATYNLYRAGLKNSLMLSSPTEEHSFKVEQLFKSIKSIKRSRRIRDSSFFSDKQIHKIYAHATLDIKLITRFLLVTGVRVSEMINIKKVDVNSTPDANIYSINILGKGLKERVIFITKDIYDACVKLNPQSKWLLTNRNGTKLNRINIYSRYKTLSKGLDFDIHPHKFRHTFTMNAINKYKTSIQAVSKYLGHSSVSVTMDIYDHDVVQPHHIVVFDEAKT